MTIRNACAVAVLCLIPFASAQAQTITIQRPPGPLDPNAGAIRVQVSINFFLPGPTNDSEQSIALRDHASRTIYAMAARECEALREKLADDCRLENVNVNINRQQQQIGGQQIEGFQVGGTLGYRISQKAAVSP
ncbi:MAG TPA: hypothetical protein VIY51_12795 [Xanthobacteraceae bacterium]